MNKKKTEVMVISKKNGTPACNIVMNGTVLKQVHKFNYLGSLITSDGRCINEIDVCFVMHVMQEPQGEQCCALMGYSWVNMT